MDWLRALTHLRQEGRSGVLITLTAVRGHAPREAGAKMVVSVDQSWDSIGGGNLEASATARARELLADGTTQRSRLASGGGKRCGRSRSGSIWCSTSVPPPPMAGSAVGVR